MGKAGFGVVIGDSIAEGHPALHGRLHPGCAAFAAEYASLPGQIAYELQQLSGFPWYNHGIGSQTTEHICARWNRDALGADDDPHDGRGRRTLPGQPDAIVVIAGVNDIMLGVSLQAMQANFTYMNEHMIRLGIPGVWLTVPPNNRFNCAQQHTVKQINAWMQKSLPTKNVGVCDLYRWYEDPTAPGRVNPSLASDYVHPTKRGYKQISLLIWRTFLEIKDNAHETEK